MYNQRKKSLNWLIRSSNLDTNRSILIILNLDFTKSKMACGEILDLDFEVKWCWGLKEFCPGGGYCCILEVGMMTAEGLLERYAAGEKDFSGINLSRAELGGANLSGIVLSNSDLREAFLEGANLEEANLEGVNLCFTNLLSANLKFANLKSTFR
jgi:Pentapeptide repeats (8 copies)